MNIGVDIGGTNLVAGLVDDTGRILAAAKTPTRAERGLQPVLDDILRITHSCVEKAGAEKGTIQSIGVGSPGIVDSRRGLLQYSNNLPFDDTPIAKILGQAWGLPVYVENDAKCAALGELFAGAAKGAQNAVIVTIGTGIGGGVILNGKLFSGSGGAGAEIGHMAIVVDGLECTCGREGCWEAYASALGLRKATQRVMEENPQSKMWAICKQDPAQITAQTAFEAAKQGDPAAEELVKWYIRHLSAGIINIANIFRPERICLGGGVANEEDAYFLDPIRAQVKQEVYGYDRCPVQVVKAKLGNDAGVIGAAFLHRQ